METKIFELISLLDELKETIDKDSRLQDVIMKYLTDFEEVKHVEEKPKAKKSVFTPELQYHTFELKYNRLKGSGKCWVAQVDRYTLKIIKFIAAETVVKHDSFKGVKIFKLPLVDDLVYCLNQTGTKTTDNKEYLMVEDGALINYSRNAQPVKINETA